VTKATAKPSTKSSAAAPAKTAKVVKDAPVKTAAASKPVAKAPPSSAPQKEAPSAKSASPSATAQASAKTAEAAVSAKPVAPARSPTKISTPDHMPTTATKVDSKLANAWKTKAGRDLSEPELMAMPESEYMNEKQLDFFRGRLTELKDDLLSNAGETTEHLREDTSIVPDPADRATIEEEHALELRTRDRERKLLKKISQALTRLDSGEYGYCDETGEPIGLGRLIARPTATLSLEAQQRRELKQKMFGD
jgi:DnaK suppressor protein